jgi:hypothetical protein
MTTQLMVQPSSLISAGIIIGRATISRFDFNDERRDEPSIQVARSFWAEAGWHPPQSDPRQE